MSNEEIISTYLRIAYSDENLAALLAHAEDGKLAFDSCCCLIGVPPSPHALVGVDEFCDERYHGGAHDLNAARAFQNGFGDRAEDAFCKLGENDIERRAKLIPLVKAEMKRREQEAERSTPELVSVLSV